MSTTAPDEGVTRRTFDVLKVSASSAPQAVAASIAKSILEDHHYPTLRAIGHGAIGQATKAIAVSRGLLAVRAIDLTAVIGFDTVTNEDGHELSAIVFRMLPR